MSFTISLDKAKKIIDGERLELDSATWQEIDASYEFLRRFSSDKVIYGINTGFGPMAQWRVDDDSLTALQYNIIRSHATGAGAPLPDRYVRAAMLARVCQLAQGYSGVHREAVELLIEMLNRDICPFIPEHGSVGASGDLVQLAHIALTLIGEGEVHYHGEWCPASEVLAEHGLRPLSIHIREGLSLTNGTSVMTGIAILNQLDAERLLDHALLAAVWLNEVAGSYDDFMSEPIQDSRRHAGQRAVGARLRELAAGSRCMRKREHYLYTCRHTDVKQFDHKVQAYYSLRCVPQIFGPVADTFDTSRHILEEELNSASDNPIVDHRTGNVYHGGNFHGDYVSLEQDKLKIATVRLAMTAERQLNYLFHDRINGILPPFLNMGVLGLNYGMQACQFTATSTTAECQTLAMPNYVHSIPNNNDNQDIVSMGTNTALLCKRVVDNAYQVMAILYIALAQATDCLRLSPRLAPATAAAYRDIRRLTPATAGDDVPFYHAIAAVEQYLRHL